VPKTPNLLVGGRLPDPVGVAAEYKRKLKRLTLRMVKQTQEEVAKLYRRPYAREYFVADDSISSQARILTNALIKKYDQLFSDHAASYAGAMLSETMGASKSLLRNSMKKFSEEISLKFSTKTKGMREFIKASTAENVALIKSIPEQYMLRVQGSVMRSITQGGVGKLTEDLRKYAGSATNRAQMIAEDQTRKAYNTMNKLRMQQVGLEKFEWIHSGGGNEPRELHEAMDGMIFSFDDLPIIDERTGERGIPGQAINCRCTMRPVIDLDEEEDIDAE